MQLRFQPILLLLFSYLQVNLSDLPVHCLHEQVRGSWVLHLGPVLGDEWQRCGHNIPDDKSDYAAIDVESAVNPTRHYEVTLEDQNVAKDAHGQVGYWTMIYDEGFEVQISGKKFFAFNRFFGSSDAKDNAPLAPKDTAGYASDCRSTSVGWYHNDNHTDWGCYYATKKEESNGGGGGATAMVEQTTQDGGLASDQMDAWSPAFIESMNQHLRQHKNWTARHYPEFAGLSVEEMISMGGGLKTSHHRHHHPLQDPTQSNHMNDPALPASEAVGTLPKHWDWRNVNGVSYLSPVRTQGSCGSCYAIAAAAMMESRIRIKTENKMQPSLSPQDIVSCSMYSQGCDGGFPYLVGKYLQDFGIVDEECFAYEKRVPCSKRCSSPSKFWKASAYRYVGGHYGGCNELDMMREIYLRGPIIIGFEAKGDLFYYSEGIYSSVTDAEFLQLSATTGKLRPWEHTNHAVLAIGWGVETGTSRKYWIAKNTWGPQWGEEGYFRIERGVDESCFESMAVAADPIVDEDEKAGDGEKEHHKHHKHHKDKEVEGAQEHKEKHHHSHKHKRRSHGSSMDA